MRGSDMLIVPGTQVVSDYNTGPWSWPYDIFVWSLLAKICRVKLLFVCVGIGPVFHPISRWFIKSALRMADGRSYREHASKTYLESLGFFPNGDRVYPDLVFSLPEREVSAWRPATSRNGVVGVAVKDYAGAGTEAQEDYLERMSRLVTWLREHGHTVRVLIGDVLYDSGVWEQFVKRLECARTGPGYGRLVAQRILTAEDLLAQLRDCDLVISPRLHNLILSVMLHRPVIALSDHPKLDSLMTELGLAEWCVSLRRLDVDLVQRKFLELEAKREQFRFQAARRAADCREALKDQYRAIVAALNCGTV
jgi:polysaccharide pyruvyl transferase WcaK-like protein